MHGKQTAAHPHIVATICRLFLALGVEDLGVLVLTQSHSHPSGVNFKDSMTESTYEAQFSHFLMAVISAKSSCVVSRISALT